MMRLIGWTLACALLAAAFPKSAIATPASEHEAGGRAGVTTRPDIPQPTRFLDDPLAGGEDAPESASRQARTFGQKRIQLLMLPMMYKMGVMMTMLTVLTILSVKGLLIGAALLMLKLASIVGKFSSGWQHHAQPSSQPIHVHVHNGLPSAHTQAYSGWMANSGPEEGAENYYYRG